MRAIPLREPSSEAPKAWMCPKCERVFWLGRGRTEEARLAAGSCCESQTAVAASPNVEAKAVPDNSLGKAKDRVAATMLASEISRISEETFCAGWLSGIEFCVWDLVQGKGVGISVDAERLAVLRKLHEESGGWWHWPGSLPNRKFVTAEEWKEIYETNETGFPV
jgi:hypothetical protein